MNVYEEEVFLDYVEDALRLELNFMISYLVWDGKF